MPLNIRDAEVDRLAKQLAALNHSNCSPPRSAAAFGGFDSGIVL
jgi:hypothetical protein